MLLILRYSGLFTTIGILKHVMTLVDITPMTLIYKPHINNSIDLICAIVEPAIGAADWARLYSGTRNTTYGTTESAFYMPPI